MLAMGICDYSNITTSVHITRRLEKKWCGTSMLFFEDFFLLQALGKSIYTKSRMLCFSKNIVQWTAKYGI